MSKNRQGGGGNNNSPQPTVQSPWTSPALALAMTSVEVFTIGIMLGENGELLDLFVLSEEEIEVQGFMRDGAAIEQKMAQEAFEQAIKNAMLNGQYATAVSQGAPKLQRDVVQLIQKDPELGMLVWNQPNNSKTLIAPTPNWAAQEQNPFAELLKTQQAEGGYIPQGDLAFLSAIERLVSEDQVNFDKLATYLKK